ncbi:MAG: myo-inositol-1-phosphate synthase [Planctomycetes bacterium]|nr:myo-inositol-1-phosphate synthase [Planctomycetota bacterium]
MSADSTRLGVWLIGARGSISTCVAYGLAGLRAGLLEPTGIATEREPFRRLGLCAFEDMVLGGHEIATGDLSRSAGELVRHGILSGELVAAASTEAAALDARIRPGVLDVADVGRAELDSRAASLGGVSPRERTERLSEDIRAFREEHRLARVVVVYLASVEPWLEDRPHFADLARFERALDQEGVFPASSLYAYAAFQAGAAFVNFTPNRGSSLNALRQLAREKKLPHCGNDGKTGETLLKTVLAPMFAARALKVLAWQGYNMLGNKDGEALADPLRAESKLRNKDAPLRAILDDDGLHTHVSIDFVPSLHDWKTAWDFVHFEGFLGAKMSLQLTWSGSDSALAAPLVLDLVRWCDLALRTGESGELAHTACYFKAPLAGGTHDFHAQFARLLAYAERNLR